VKGILSALILTIIKEGGLFDINVNLPQGIQFI